MSRDEYLQKANEGFIKDTIRKGVEKVKNLFRIGMAKIKDFIAIFDSNGNVLPVISPAAIIDHFSDSNAVSICASAEMSDNVVAAGGNSNVQNLSEKDDDEVYDLGPKGKEYSKWIKEKGYENSVEYRNFMAIPGLIKEHFECSDEEASEIFEDMVSEAWEGEDGIVKKRVKYKGKNDEIFSLIDSIDYDEYENVISTLIDRRLKYGNTPVIGKNGKQSKPGRNLLIFGAPGIGKSTIPNMIVRKYNEKASGDPSKMISVISINCSNIHEGDFLMPIMPRPEKVDTLIKKFAKSFPTANDFIEGLDDEQQETLARNISNSGQYKSSDAPKSWLPSYLETGDDDIDKLLDAYANGGVFKDEQTNTTIKTGNGGIIIFDELLRADPVVFDQMMNFLLDRRCNGWLLGSKWAIVGCSNRPCDSVRVEEVWGTWNGEPASKSRWAKIYHLDPSPEQWRKWAESKGFDSILLDFIFENNSRVDGEYPRWHSMTKNGSGPSAQVKTISPRDWEVAFDEINTFENENNLNDISEMKMKDIRKCFSNIFDKEFIEIIMRWLEDNMSSVDLQRIIDDPEGTPIPAKFKGKDKAKSAILITNVWNQFEARFKDAPEECTDDILANIILWLGKNYPDDVSTFNIEFLEKLSTVLTDGSDNCIPSKIKSLKMWMAAYPYKDKDGGIEKDIKEREESPIYTWEKGSLEEVKDLMRKHFPWRIDGDEVQYVNGLKLD